MTENKPFYSRKLKKWFRNYNTFTESNKIQKTKFYNERAAKLQYNKRTGLVYDPLSKKTFRPRKPRT